MGRRISHVAVSATGASNFVPLVEANKKRYMLLIEVPPDTSPGSCILNIMDGRPGVIAAPFTFQVAVGGVLTLEWLAEGRNPAEHSFVGYADGGAITVKILEFYED